MTDALALEAAGELALSAEALAAVRERSGGNPLFIRELVESARGARDAEVLPETVETLITSRIDTLSPDDRFLLRNAAVIGTRFEPDLLVEVLGHELDDVGERTRWESLAEFVACEGAAEVRFRHDRFRAVSYEGSRSSAGARSTGVSATRSRREARTRRFSRCTTSRPAVTSRRGRAPSPRPTAPAQGMRTSWPPISTPVRPRRRIISSSRGATGGIGRCRCARG